MGEEDEALDLGADTPENRARLERLGEALRMAGERIGTEDDGEAPVVKSTDAGEWALDFSCAVCGFPIRVWGVAEAGEKIRRAVTCPNCGASGELEGEIE